jgi:hypothetical protein
MWTGGTGTGQGRHAVGGHTATAAERTIIGQATGMLMEALDGTADEAFACLVQMSSYANAKVRDVAAMMVQNAETRAKVGRVAAHLLLDAADDPGGA